MDKTEARNQYDDLMKRLTELSKLTEGNMAVSESDVHKWNLNCAETTKLED